MNKIRTLAILAVMLQCACMGPAQAQEYPAKSIRFLVGYAAGGANDVLGRLLADSWQRQLGQSVVVENRPGASGLLAAEALAKSPPDGYTVMIGSGGTLTMAVHLIKAGFDPLKDIAGISLLGINDAAIVVDPKFPARNIQDLVALAKKDPGKYAFGTSGPGGPLHLAAELLKDRAGIAMTHIPYKGDAQGLADVMGGNLPMMFVSVPSATSMLKSGSVRAIAVLTDRRSQEFPDVPTVAESGYPGYFVNQWVGPIAPAGTPAAIIQKLNAATRVTVADAAVVKKMAALGSRAEGGTPDDLNRLIASEFNKWGGVIRTQNIKLE